MFSLGHAQTMQKAKETAQNYYGFFQYSLFLHSHSQTGNTNPEFEACMQNQQPIAILGFRSPGILSPATCLGCEGPGRLFPRRE